MKKVELCTHNLKTEPVQAAATKLEAALAGKATVERVSCIGDCKACHAGALIAKIGEQVVAEPDSDLVIAKVLSLVG